MRLISLLSRICLCTALVLNGFALPSSGAHAASPVVESSYVAPCHESPVAGAEMPDHDLPGNPDQHDGNSGAGQDCCSGGCNCACMTSTCVVSLASLEFAFESVAWTHTRPDGQKYFPPQLHHLTRPPIA
ncbi:MAG: CopL family metal-binding regulatory protein [Dokdonella sp.]|nr:MAG: CopL family metal-binding regulatory protein [Dokdonella sp.]